MKGMIDRQRERLVQQLANLSWPQRDAPHVQGVADGRGEGVEGRREEEGRSGDDDGDIFFDPR